MTGRGVVKGLKVMGLAVLSVVFGLFGFGLLFSDLGPGEPLLSRLIVAALVSVVAGLVVGYLGRTTWRISGLIGWGGVLLALQSLLNRDSEIMQTGILLLVSPAAALLGGYLGSVLGGKWPLPHLARGLRRRR